MLVVDSNSFLSTLGLQKDLKEDDLITIPEGMDHHSLDLMMRILTASYPKELEDIATEEIVGLFDHITDVAPYLGESNRFASGSFTKDLERIRPAKTRKRVL